MIRALLYIYMLLLLVDFFVSLFPQLQIQPWVKSLRQWTSPSSLFVRRFIPMELPVDFSPLLVIALLLLVIKLW